MNPEHEYNDEQFARYSMELNDAIGGMWEAGAALEDIQSDVENGIENAAGFRVRVLIDERV